MIDPRTKFHLHPARAQWMLVRYDTTEEVYYINIRAALYILRMVGCATLSLKSY